MHVRTHTHACITFFLYARPCMFVHLQEQPLCPLVVVRGTRKHLLQGGGVAKVTPVINCMLNKRTSPSTQFEQHKDEGYMTQLASHWRSKHAQCGPIPYASQTDSRYSAAAISCGKCCCVDGNIVQKYLEGCN